jgi:MtrB/PioB family decaheme-associated outer membrane protein
MKTPNRTLLTLSTLLAATLGTTGSRAEEEQSYTSLALANLPVTDSADANHLGRVQLGGALTFDDNYMFGQYSDNGEDTLTLIGDLRWKSFSDKGDYWQLSFSDLGLDTREGQAVWGRPDRLRVTVGFDSQQQIRNDSGSTPFNGDYMQTLPADWVAGTGTSEFGALATSLQGFDRKLDRDEFSLAVEARLSQHWRVHSSIAYEEKEGHGDVGAGIYINGASADALLLRAPVDYQNTDIDLGLSYEGSQLVVHGTLAYTEFDNKEDLLVWQNPYSNFGSSVSYPSGSGGLGLMPDSEQGSGRLTGHYVISTKARFQFDGNYALSMQDQDFADYSVNSALNVVTPLPAQDLDGEVASGTFNGKLLLMPWRKFTAEIYYKLRDRDYDVDRNGYLYVRGDGSDQPDARHTVYNTAHDLTSQTGGVEVSYRLPLRSKLSVEYAYEEVERTNAAVEKTEEDRYSIAYRIQPWNNFSARLNLLYADRAAGTYQWDQSYYALLDSALINATPDSQRYINHPQLFQHHLANRERWEGKLNLNLLPASRWNLGLNLLWRYDEYEKSDFGLVESEWIGGHFTASFATSDDLSVTFYTGYDRYDGNQSSRAFRGGLDKNAFAIYPPLPQASDPSQNWDLDAADHTITVGANVHWQPAENYEFELDYSYVDTRAEQELDTSAGAATVASNLPDVDTRLHHLQAGFTWHLQEDVSLRLDYQFYAYESDDWAWDDLQADSLDKVLTFGQGNPDEDIHYVGVSAIYRWN